MNNLDNFYNKKLQNRTFEFKDSYWEGAEKLIIADEKNRRRGLFFWLFGLLFIFTLGGAVLWFSLPKAEKELASTSFLNNLPENKSLNTKSTNQHLTQTNEELSRESDNLSELNILRSNTKELNNSTSDFKNNEINQATINIKQAVKSQNPITSKNNEEPILESTAIVQLKTRSEALKNNKPEIANQNILDNSIENKNDQTDLAETDQTKKSTISLLNPIDPVLEKIENPEYPNLQKLSIPKTKLFRLGLTASSLFYPAKNSEETWIGASFGLVGQYQFQKAFSLNSELLYTYRTGTFGAVSKTEQTNYSFGREQVEHSLQPKSVHFVELPIYLQFRSGRHGIEGGLTFTYLTGVYGNIEEQKSLFPWERSSETSVSEETLSSGWLSKSDFKSFNTSGLLGYRYYVNQNFMVGLRASYRFSDFFKNSDNNEQALLESGPLYFNVSASWFFLK